MGAYPTKWPRTETRLNSSEVGNLFLNLASMIKTIVWFGCGGFFTACYSNAVRRYPVFRKPGMHVFFTSIGLALGYGMHRFEENAEEIFKKLVKKHKCLLVPARCAVS